MTAITEQMRPWAPDGLEGHDPRGLSYVVVDEIEGGAVGLAVSEWPRVDAEGRLRFGLPPILLGADRASLQRFLDAHRRTSRSIRIGDVFAARTRPVEEAEARLEPMLQPEEWIEPPVYDITADARDAAKASFYSAVTPTLGPAEVAKLADIIERPPPPPPSAAPPTTPPVRPPRPPWQTLVQVVAGAALFAGGIGAGVGVAAAGSSSETVTEPGSVSVKIVNFTQTITVRETIRDGETIGTTTAPTVAQRVTVPNVVGMSQVEAESTLAEEQLLADATEVPSDTDEKGTVTAQDPLADEEADAGSTVQLSVSSGPTVSSSSEPEQVRVPSVTDQTLKLAVLELRRAGFRYTRTDMDSDQPKLTVVDQDPEAESLEPPGTIVTLTVSLGPTAKTSAVPDVVGLTRDAAEAELKAAGFGASAQIENTTEESNDGIVMRQDPLPETDVEPGFTVTIVVGQFQSVD